VPQPETPFEEAVAAATTSWMGTGGASYRVGAEPGATDTVYLGVFDRAAIESVGLFDERLIRNQDYELNIRLREAGHTIWFDPELWVGYRPRGAWGALARQYYEYGRWKAVVMGIHPGSTRLRQIAPPIAMATVAGAALLAPRRSPLAAIPALYATALVVTSAARSGRQPLRAGLTAMSLATIHLSWAIGLILGLPQTVFRVYAMRRG
jgi:hypothetical protein